MAGCIASQLHQRLRADFTVGRDFLSSGTLAGQHATFGIQSNAAVAIHRDVHVKHFVRFSLEVQRSISHERVSAYTGWGCSLRNKDD